MLPGDYIISYGDIKKFFNNEEYEVMTPDGKDIKLFPPEDFASFYYLWDDFRLFGLPHGGGPADELPWVVDFLRFFQGVADEISHFKMKKR